VQEEIPSTAVNASFIVCVCVVGSSFLKMQRCCTHDSSLWATLSLRLPPRLSLSISRCCFLRPLPHERVFFFFFEGRFAVAAVAAFESVNGVSKKHKKVLLLCRCCCFSFLLECCGGEEGKGKDIYIYICVITSIHRGALPFSEEKGGETRKHFNGAPFVWKCRKVFVCGGETP
jgi:hypothetical protein